MRSLIICLVLFGLKTTSYSQKDQLVEAFKNKNFEQVFDISENILKTNPEDFDALLLSGRSYNTIKQFDKAIPLLSKGVEIANKDWQFAWCYTELVDSYFAIGNKEKSLELYNKAKRVEGTKNSKKRLKKLELLFGFDTSYNNWKTIETDYIIFHFQDATAIKNIEFYVKERVNAFVSINSFFNSKLPKKIDFFVWKNQKEAQKILGSKAILGFSNPIYCIAHNHPKQSTGHEIAHNISHWFNKPVNKTRLINEGIGVYFDQSDTNRILKAKEVLNKQTLDIVDMWKNGRNYSDKILYPVGGAFVKQLIVFDKDKFLELCTNQTYENAQNIYGSELENIISNFNSQLNK